MPSQARLSKTPYLQSCRTALYIKITPIQSTYKMQQYTNASKNAAVYKRLKNATANVHLSPPVLDMYKLLLHIHHNPFRPARLF